MNAISTYFWRLIAPMIYCVTVLILYECVCFSVLPLGSWPFVVYSCIASNER